VATIRYGIDPRPFEQVDPSMRLSIRSEWSVPEDAILFGTAARFAEQKALHILLGGYARYRQTAKIASRLALLGHGPLEQDLKKRAQQLNIADEVIWAGFRNDMQAVMSAFDVFALTSVREGLGLSILEAMSASKPVIATAVGGIPEILLHEHAGLLCQVNSTQDVANAMLRCESASLRAQLGAAGHARVLSEFTIDKMVAETSEIYAAAIKARERRSAVRSNA
jgi:glycosyltransferase involved in cell wall biosynthesis